MTQRTALLLSVLAAGCAYEEELPETDLNGTIRLPIAASQFLYEDPETGEARVVDDARGLGPVYVGAFPSIQDDLYEFPHPEFGPVLNPTRDGDTYPYGGTSVGRFDWACYQQMICQVVTGRFSSYDDLLDYFANVLNNPVSDAEGVPVTSGTAFQERCFEVLFMTGDQELLFVDPETDFSVSSDGQFYEAEIELPHVIYNEGMVVWAWMDMPSPSYQFSTCNESEGENILYYAETYRAGTNNIDLLNFPGNYIDSGDWIAQEGAIINQPGQDFELELGFHYVVE
ncbi:MAG: hypothetical protein AAFV53_33370 [Myxococcota bacterium]